MVINAVYSCQTLLREKTKMVLKNISGQSLPKASPWNTAALESKPLAHEFLGNI
jgi:hypothetical protein